MEASTGFQPPPPLNYTNLIVLRGDLNKIIDDAKSAALTIKDQERLNKFIEHKFNLMLHKMKIHIGGSARFFRIVNDVKVQLKWKDEPAEEVKVKGQDALLDAKHVYTEPKPG